MKLGRTEFGQNDFEKNGLRQFRSVENRWRSRKVYYLPCLKQEKMETGRPIEKKSGENSIQSTIPFQLNVVLEVLGQKGTRCARNANNFRLPE